MARKKTKASIAKLKLSPAQLKKAKACLERSGKVTFGFKTVSVTRLPKSIGPVAVFMD